MMGADSAHVGGLRESLRGNQAVRLCPWPGLPELSWSRRVHAAGWVGCRASRPLGVCPQIIAGHHESLLGSHNCLPAHPAGSSWLGWGGLSCTRGWEGLIILQLQSWAAPLRSLPSATLSSRQPIVYSSVNRSCSLGPQSRQDPGLVCRAQGWLGGRDGAGPRAVSPERRHWAGV